MPTRAPLPIDAFLPEIVRTLAAGANVLSHAPPGAGKTTCVPVAMFEAGLADDPGLSNVAAVVFDEFHERHLEGDLALALVRRLQRHDRRDLRIVVMSATLPTGRIEPFLDATSIACPGRAWPVDIEHVEHIGERSDRTLVRDVAAAVRRLVDQGLDGHVLVFLSGAKEIRAVAEACESMAACAGFELLSLHGDLAPEAQDRAVAPSSRKKVILTTNAAETSITIDGVNVVIDSGLARLPSFDAFSGRPTLDLVKISRASAVQRAGRAGRTAPGRCLRLYTRRDFEHRPEHPAPEILRLDLAPTLLELRVAGVRDPTAFEWFEPPPRTSIDSAERLLHRLGATTEVGGALTAEGRHMAALPLHPQHARVLLEAARRGATELGAMVAALLSERPLRREADAGLHRACDADLIRDAEAVLMGEVDPAFATRLRRTKQPLLEFVRRELPATAGPRSLSRADGDVAVRMALLHGFRTASLAREAFPEGNVRWCCAAEDRPCSATRAACMPSCSSRSISSNAEREVSASCVYVAQPPSNRNGCSKRFPNASRNIPVGASTSMHGG